MGMDLTSLATWAQTFLRWPQISIEPHSPTVALSKTVAIDLRITNQRTRSIRLRDMHVQVPRAYAPSNPVLLIKPDGSTERIKVETRGRPMHQLLDGPLGIIIPPACTLVLELWFHPDDGLDIHLTWRIEGARSWPCVPITIGRSRNSLEELCRHQLLKFAPRGEDEEPMVQVPPSPPSGAG
jgi:hypothetical protein